MIRVLVADDSAFSRVTLSKMIEKDREIQVVATAVNGEQAIRHVVALQPDLITLDLEMPGMDGFSVLRWLAANRPTPTIVVSSRGGAENVLRALDLGAVDFVLKPSPHATPELIRLEDELLAKVRAAARARPAPPVSHAPAPAEFPGPGNPEGLVVIGASTGGPSAVASVLAGLPRLPCPLVLAQHMPAGFTGLFAERLSRLANFSVKEAREGEILTAREAYVAPGGFHLEIVRATPYGVRLIRRSPEDFYCPSVDRLLMTAAAAAGPRTVAVILTGMGSDGREGILSVRAAGGRTIAESEQTAVVFGMPREAAESGAVEEILPVTEIPAAIVRRLAEVSPAVRGA
jgi:two-component system chemotaxis response regulator CheB